MQKKNVLGINVHNITKNELFEKVFSFIKAHQTKKVMYANIHVLNTAYSDNKLKNILNESDIVYCDGEGVRLGAKLLGENIHERMTGADWIHDICPMLSKSNYSIYLLGGHPNTPEKTKKILEKNHTGLKVVGINHGFFNFFGDENKKIIDDINKKKPDILFVGFGTPVQEKWIEDNYKDLNIPVIWAVGAMMDFVTGNVKRAPEFMLRNKMEWLYRLFSEPKRMWKRYIVGNVLFFVRIVTNRRME